MLLGGITPHPHELSNDGASVSIEILNEVTELLKEKTAPPNMMLELCDDYKSL